MNLQVVCPYTKCPFACPCCIAGKMEKEEYPFADLHESNAERYWSNFMDWLDNSYDTIVITGDTEPTLFQSWVKDVVYFAKMFSKKVEIQTRNYNATWLYDLDIDYIAFSCVEVEHIKQLYNNRHKYDLNRTRIVMLETDELKTTTENLVELAKPFAQRTIKKLQLSEKDDINSWIDSNTRKGFTKNYVDLTRISRYDKDCQNAKDRYEIFRTDGRIYANWFDTTPLF